jgi:molecular chaperone GrpE
VTDHQEPDAPEAASAEDPRLPLEAEIERLRAEADRFRDEMLRARAELDNVRKRAQRDLESAHRFLLSYRATGRTGDLGAM